MKEGKLNERRKLNNFIIFVKFITHYSIFFPTVTNEDVLLQLEREVSSSNSVISKQQKEITELQQLCCIMQKVSSRSLPHLTFERVSVSTV